MGRIMGLDLGDVRVGIAISDESRFLASGYGFVEYRGYNDLIKKIINIARKEEVDKIVVGLPLNMDGSKGPQAAKAEKIALLLKQKSGLAANLIDERLSTVEASRQLHAGGKKAQKGLVDMVSATVILQAFLDGQKD
ncbi:MAG: Holliday junction resolvase RuvX [candidate division Zixibacteria bacterium]|nr:Holliday junction resolvase RuvX [candidate division Zixibacteria bacterium]